MDAKLLGQRKMQVKNMTDRKIVGKFINKEEDVLSAVRRIKHFNARIWEKFIENECRIDQKLTGYNPDLTQTIEFIMLSQPLKHTDFEKEQNISTILSDPTLMIDNLEKIKPYGVVSALPNISLQTSQSLRRLKYICQYDNINMEKEERNKWFRNLTSEILMVLLYQPPIYSTGLKASSLYFDLRTFVRTESNLTLI